MAPLIKKDSRMQGKIWLDIYRNYRFSIPEKYPMTIKYRITGSN